MKYQSYLYHTSQYAHVLGGIIESDCNANHLFPVLVGVEYVHSQKGESPDEAEVDS